MLGHESPQRAAKAKAPLEDEEIEAERACPHPGGDDGLGGAVQAGHQGDPGDAAHHHRDEEPRDKSPQRGLCAHEREENRRDTDDRVAREPALHPGQEGRANDGAETEAGEQSAVAQGIEAEISARDDGQQGPEGAATDNEDSRPNQHGDERRGVACVTYTR